MRKHGLALIFLAVATVSSAALADTYRIDNDHTSITFSVKHLGVFNIKGTFGYFSGAFDFDQKGTAITSANIEIMAETVDTGVAKRDEAIRSPDFLYVEKFPSITFHLKSSRPMGDNRIHAVGDITIRGITKEIALDGEYLGAVKDNVGNERVGFTAHGVLMRSDFGMTWNQPLDTGGVMVGEEVKVTLEMEGIKNK